MKVEKGDTRNLNTREIKLKENIVAAGITTSEINYQYL